MEPKTRLYLQAIIQLPLEQVLNSLRKERGDFKTILEEMGVRFQNDEIVVGEILTPEQKVHFNHFEAVRSLLHHLNGEGDPFILSIYDEIVNFWKIHYKPVN